MTQTHNLKLTIALLVLLVCISPAFLLNIPAKIAVLISIVAIAGLGVVFTAPKFLLLGFVVSVMLMGLIKMSTGYHPISRLAPELALIVTLIMTIAQRYSNPPLTKVDFAQRQRFYLMLAFLLIFYMWVFIQVLNPRGPGFIGWLVGQKSFLLPFMVWILIVFYLRTEEIRQIPFVILILGTLHGIIAYLDWKDGGKFLVAFNPFYAVKYEQYKIGPMGANNYRPFGLGQGPGHPALFINYAFTSAVLVWHLIGNRAHSLSYRFKNWQVWFWKAIIAICVPTGFMALLACQGRTALMRSAAVLLAGVFFSGKQGRMLSIFGAIIAVIFLLSLPKQQPMVPTSEIDEEEVRMNVALDRAASLTSTKVLTSSRSTGLHEILEVASIHTSQGVGIGRGAIHGGVLIYGDYDKSRDPYSKYTWSDNVYYFLFVELGIGGLLTWLGVLGCVVWVLLSVDCYPRRIVAVYVALNFVAGFGAETPFAQPDAAMFWLFVGWAMRYLPEPEAN